MRIYQIADDKADFTQHEMADLARPYADQWNPGEPAHLHPDALQWRYEPAYPLSAIYHNTKSQTEWAKWFKHEQKGDGQRIWGNAFVKYWQSHPNDPIVLVEIPTINKSHPNPYVWDGNHRIGLSACLNQPTIPAIVGTKKTTMARHNHNTLRIHAIQEDPDQAWVIQIARLYAFRSGQHGFDSKPEVAAREIAPQDLEITMEEPAAFIDQHASGTLLYFENDSYASYHEVCKNLTIHLVGSTPQTIQLLRTNFGEHNGEFRSLTDLQKRFQRGCKPWQLKPFVNTANTLYLAETILYGEPQALPRDMSSENFWAEQMEKARAIKNQLDLKRPLEGD